jgi:hypothetical protein
VSLVGPCEDCGDGAPLRYQPGAPISEQNRPSLCDMCVALREQQLSAPEPIDPDYHG